MDFSETDEQIALRHAVSKLAQSYGPEYCLPRCRSREPLRELWQEAGQLGFLGVNLPEEYGGGGAGMYELTIVYEELSAQLCGLLMMVVSPAIAGTIITRFGTDEQKSYWLPGMATGEKIIAFGITEPDAGTNSHNIATVARRDGSDWLLTGRKTFISGVDQADAVLIVARTEDAKTGKLKPALFLMPTDSPNLVRHRIELDLGLPDNQFALFLDDVRLPSHALVGEHDSALWQLFAGLNPERLMVAAGSAGVTRYFLDKAVGYTKTRSVWGTPIGAHQGLAHPLAQIKIEHELAKLMLQKAATVYDTGDDLAAGEAANMARFAGAEVAARANQQAVQSMGGNGLAAEHGMAMMLSMTALGRIAPVSREMVLNYVAQNSLGLPKSY
ncbi:acyl-CoA dehydrogenase family protein [Mycobacteroides immunogenum]|uniref:Acyl-CoA dehydrogenase n=1 Tax=Mycobacteroides immunogenum TaxID=83262 RepID=A0A7V8RYK6_9MYCO|nr:acyl-CoA dehydrogenase family protein [Mycobacteroides immunogenum]AMT73275.1 acyl-CoA dehydrogenase [Mycobacteroides immunogenum]ANO06435.1 acyl-CoA dehydrogenase [Mycobacteroides immunogenum]KIU39762.1 acyl-CoA dehydrogenase [Mycobacteroides immunogenum]KPG10669.1 acyl-CoA dehydrogenase [Mycobacteroides immunogenum]KPG12806.1 acyl-CoA dehydrogenase [Mycobacteroides immunogenum]